jgi:hypothetical protein
MGNFYSNITLSTNEQQPVIDYLNEFKRHAYVYKQDKFVCVFPANDQVLFKLAKRLSEHFKCAAIGVMNHDDSLLLYKLFDCGNLLDDYNSCPGYFSGEEQPIFGGDAQKLCEIYGAPKEVEAVDALLRKEYTFEMNRHDALVDKLGLPTCTAGGGFSYLQEDDGPDELDVSDLIETHAEVDAHEPDNEPDDELDDELDDDKLKATKSASAKSASQINEILSSPDFLKQALKQAQEGANQYVQEMLEVRVEGTAGGGAVVVTSIGNLQFSSIKISDEAINSEEVGLLEDLVLTALNDAARKTSEKMEEVKKRMLSAKLGQLGL